MQALYLHCRHMRDFQLPYRHCRNITVIVMRVIVKKWGNSAAVRIPKGIMQAARLGLEDAVEVREQDGEIVIKPIRSGKVDLGQLLAAITPENLHGGIDFGIAVGKESL